MSEISHWDDIYKNSDVESLPWYNKNLDPDLQEALNKLRLNGGNFLDIGTGPGTQAVELAKIGFNVTGIDISQTAIEKAKKVSKDVNFIVDDILDTKLPNNNFDFIFDRGCFHVLPITQLGSYIQTVNGLLKDNGLLFLKCFSTKEKNINGPNRFSPEEMREIFQASFDILGVKDTFYQGTLEENPKALFIVLKKPSLRLHIYMPEKVFYIG